VAGATEVARRRSRQADGQLRAERGRDTFKGRQAGRDVAGFEACDRGLRRANALGELLLREPLRLAQRADLLRQADGAAGLLVASAAFGAVAPRGLDLVPAGSLR